jgi:hypothetical protein
MSGDGAAWAGEGTTRQKVAAAAITVATGRSRRDRVRRSDMVGCLQNRIPGDGECRAGNQSSGSAGLPDEFGRDWTPVVG